MHFKAKSSTLKKGQGWNPSPRSTRQIKAREHMSPKNITMRTPLIK
jgi:hypothetical protein